MADETPSTEDRAKFYMSQSIKLVGYEDTLATITGDDPHAEGPASDPAQAIRNLSITFDEGVRRSMRNSREHGTHPVSAFEGAVRDEWPEWVKVSLAEQEHHTFAAGFPEDMEDEVAEYLDYLEDEYGVPR